MSLHIPTFSFRNGWMNVTRAPFSVPEKILSAIEAIAVYILTIKLRCSSLKHKFWLPFVLNQPKNIAQNSCFLIGGEIWNVFHIKNSLYNIETSWKKTTFRDKEIKNTKYMSVYKW